MIATVRHLKISTRNVDILISYFGILKESIDWINAFFVVVINVSVRLVSLVYGV
jgi:hypothetical protein